MFHARCFASWMLPSFAPPASVRFSSVLCARKPTLVTNGTLSARTSDGPAADGGDGENPDVVG